MRALGPAREALEKDGVVFLYTDVLALLAPIERVIAEQGRGTHADEKLPDRGAWGDPTLATRAKGERIVEEFLPRAARRHRFALTRMPAPPARRIVFRA